MMNTQLYCDTDADGYITTSLAGERVIPMQQYDYFFYLADADIEKVNENIPRYRVINGELTLV